MKRLFLSAFCLLLLPVSALSQSTNIPPDIDKNGRTITPRPMPHLIYSPADLAHNAVTLPASGTTSTSAVVNMGAVTKSTIYVNCTQIVNVQVNTYKEDGATIDGTYTLVTNLPAGAQQIYIASELAPNSTAGTISTNVRLPQRAFSFQEVNTYKEDGVTLDGTYTVVTNLPAGAQQIYIASELAPNSTAGTISTNVRLPQRAFSFQEVNTTASAGTCTDRFVVGY